MQIELGNTIKYNVQSVIGHPEQSLTTIQVDKAKVLLEDNGKDSLILNNVVITLLGDDSILNGPLSDEQKARIDTFSK